MRALFVLVIAASTFHCGSKDGDKQQLAGSSTGSGSAPSDPPDGKGEPDRKDPTGGPVMGPDKQPPPDPSCAKACNEAADCPASKCECEDGTVVTARSCVNRCCLDTTATCGGTCEDHDGMKGTWNEQREGGKQVGKACKVDGDCARDLCYRGYCTRSCDSESECPPFWNCEEVGRAKEKLCVRR